VSTKSRKRRGSVTRLHKQRRALSTQVVEEQ